MRNNLLSFIVFLTLCVCALPARAAGETYSVWDGSTEAIALSDVIEIQSAEELAGLAVLSQSQDFANKTIELRVNIDLNNKAWKPIGSAAKPFKGQFKGNGHLIRGIRAFSDATDGVGLFGHVGTGAMIKQLGVNGLVMAKSKRRVGTLAGVCDGAISECWSMAEIVASGNITGGLVGDLTSHGTITDCYQSGLIYHAGDTVGGIVGRNAGKITRVYNSGYTANGGMAIVGLDAAGTYSECYFDRKAYLQKGGIEGNVLTPIDSTEYMFSLFSNNYQWTKSATRYPMLTAFAGTDAASLSVAPIILDKTATDPVEHANDVTLNFTVSIEGGITWTCQTTTGAELLQFNNTTGDVTVIRPCEPVDVLVDAVLGSEKRVVYFSPRRVEDLLPGTFTGYDHDRDTSLVMLCFNTTWKLDQFSEMSLASQGWLVEGGDYSYKVERFTVDPITGEETYLETMFPEGGTEAYQQWYDTCHFPTNVADYFVIRSYVHDDGCNTDWRENKTGIHYLVFAEFIPGHIQTKSDTIMLEGASVKVSTTGSELSTGGEEPIEYHWYVNGVKIGTQNGVELVDFVLTKADTYKFTRSTEDANCYTPPQVLEELGVYTVLVIDPFDPGQILSTEDTTFCTPADAQAHIVTATAASGAVTDLGYSYKWYKDGQEIANSDQRDLPLSGITFEAGHGYTFTRKATNNSRFTDWTDSRYSQTIHIAAPLTPGAIPTETRDTYCFEADAEGSTFVTIAISEQSAASCTDGVKYQWICDQQTKPVSVDKDLNITVKLSDIKIGRTYTYTRQVRNAQLDCGWVDSEGAVKITFGQKQYREVTTIICSQDLPYTMILADGTELYFRTAEDTKLVNSAAEGECANETLYKLEIAAMPEFTIEDKVIGWCQGSSTMGLSYTDDPSKPANTFLITYSPDLQAIMGKRDTTGVITTQGYIEFTNVPYMPSDKELYMTLQLGYQSEDSEGSCFSAPSEPLRLYPTLGGYVYSKYDRVIFVDNNPNNGALADSVDNKLDFVSYQWYKNGYEQQGQTGQYYHEGGTILRGVFYCMLTGSDGRTYRTCDYTLPKESASNAPKNSSVYPIPVQAGDAITIETFGDAQIVTFSGERISNLIHVEGKSVIAAPHMAGIYYVQITTAEGVMEMHKLIVK